MKKLIGGLIGLLGLYNCDTNPPKLEAINTTQSNMNISSDPLVDAVLKEYEKTKDESKLEKAAKRLEAEHNYRGALSIYKTLNDKTSIKRVAVSYFNSSILLTTGETILKEVGLEITAGLYSGRGDYQIKDGYLEAALESYAAVNDKIGIRKCAVAFEKGHKLRDAFDSYKLIDDETSMGRVAEKIFVITMFTDYGKKLLKDNGKEISPELWNKRAEYQLRMHDYGAAIEAYKEASNEEAVKLILEKYTK